MPTPLFDPAHYAFNPMVVPTLITMLAISVLGWVVFLSERRSVVSVTFFSMTLTISIWLFAFSWMYCAVDEPTALWWARAAYLGVPFIPAAVYHFTVAVLRRLPYYRRVVWMAWGLSAAFSVAILQTDWLVAGLYHYWWGYYPRYGWLSVPYLAYFFAVVVASLWLYASEYRHVLPGTIHRRRVRAFLVAFAIAYLGSVDYLPKYGIPVYPFGYLPVLAFLVLAARAIRRYRLVDLTPAFAANQILSTMSDALLVCDVDGIIRVVNHAASALFGYHELELLGQPIERLARHASFRQEHLAGSTRAVTLRDREARFYTKGGQPVDVSLAVTSLHGPARVAVGSIVIARDIRERKQVEARERRLMEAAAAAGLEAQQRAEELRHAYEQLQHTQAMLVQAEKFAAVGQLASGVAHEVKNPLGILLLGVEYLERSTIGPDQADILMMMKEAVRRADQIIRGLLDFSRPARLEFKPMPLQEVIDASLVLVERQLARRDNIQVVKQIPPALPQVAVNDTYLQQAFINIILNAAQAMPDGGQLTVRCAERVIVPDDPVVGRHAMEAFKPGDHVILCDIADTGVGIPPDALTKVFDPFFTTRPPREGTGLGLTVTRAIIQQHHGRIAIESTVGQGTTVRIVLPINRRASGQDAGEPFVVGGGGLHAVD